MKPEQKPIAPLFVNEKTIAAAWQAFADEFIPKNTWHPVQVNITRDAFYAGAATLMLLAKQALEDDDDDEACDMLDALEAELLAFTEEGRKA